MDTLKVDGADEFGFDDDQDADEDDADVDGEY